MVLVMKKLLFALAVLFCIAPAAFAEVKVGDKPVLSFHAVDGTPINLTQLRGKMVIVDFWATWCEPCMAEADHMVMIKDQYTSRGVQIIGISLDSSKPMMLKVAKEKGFTWPQYFDGKVWQNDISTEWGVGSIPATFIISPEGEVLWRGGPEIIDKHLEKALKEHPPRLLDPKQIAEANTVIEKTQSLIKAGDFSGALKSFAKLLPDARTDSEFRPRVEEIQKQLENYATRAADEAE